MLLLQKKIMKKKYQEILILFLINNYLTRKFCQLM